MAGSTARKASTPSKGPSKARSSSSATRNKSILNFFQKTDGPAGATSSQSRITQFVTSSRSPSSGGGTPTSQRRNNVGDDTANGLFLEDKKGLAVKVETNDRPRSRTPEDIWGDVHGFSDDDQRYNENGSSSKRRKVDSPSALLENGNTSKPAQSSAPAKAKTSGPFIDESDIEDDMEAYRELDEVSPAPATTTDDPLFALDEDPVRDPPAEQPPVVREVTSLTDDDEFADFDDLEEDESVGEEFRERPWEDEEEELRLDENDVADLNGTDTTTDAGVTCPICLEVLAGLSETVRTFVTINLAYRLTGDRMSRFM